MLSKSQKIEFVETILKDADDDLQRALDDVISYQIAWRSPLAKTHKRHLKNLEVRVKIHRRHVANITDILKATKN